MEYNRDGDDRSRSWILLCKGDDKAMEGSLGKSRNNRLLCFLVQRWILEYEAARVYLHRRRVICVSWE